MSSATLRKLLRQQRRRRLEKALEAAENLIALLERHGILVEEAYLFGSRVRGDALEDSDVDLVIVSRFFRDMKYLDRLELIYRLEWMAGIRPWVEVIPLTPEELRERLEAPSMLREASRRWLRLR